MAALARKLLSLAALLSCALGVHSAQATPPERLRLSSSSSCPSADQVVKQLAPLLPHTRVEVGPAVAGAASATIEDNGVTVRVAVGNEERVFNDAERVCSERARASAVFVGLVLDPPLLPEPEPPPARDEPAQRPAPTPAPPAQRLTLELGPLLEAAPISDTKQPPIAGGFGGRLAWGRDLGIAIGAAFLLPTRLELPAADARLVWLPFDLSLRASRRVGEVRLGAELGPEFALLFASGDRVLNPRTSTRLEVGARGALSITWGMSQRVGAYFSLFGVWRPKPYEFRVNPDVASGSTPPVWVGSSLGLALQTL